MIPIFMLVPPFIGAGWGPTFRLWPFAMLEATIRAFRNPPTFPHPPKERPLPAT